MVFKDGIHEKNYYRFLQEDRTRDTDTERKSLFYLLALTDETRYSINQLYDFEEHWIIPKGLNQPWQTSATSYICMLAFNLYNGYRGEDGEYCYVTPVNVFQYREFREYMIEAIKIRFDDIE